MKKFVYHLTPVIVYMVIVLVFSMGQMEVELPAIWQKDKLLHLAAYSIMGYLWSRGLNGFSGFKNRRKLVIISFAITFAYGAFIEVFQWFMPLRSFSTIDAVANGIGGFAGGYIYYKTR